MRGIVRSRLGTQLKHSCANIHSENMARKKRNLLIRPSPLSNSPDIYIKTGAYLRGTCSKLFLTSPITLTISKANRQNTTP